jgi:hypothetical protein
MLVQGLVEDILQSQSVSEVLKLEPKKKEKSPLPTGHIDWYHLNKLKGAGKIVKDVITGYGLNVPFTILGLIQDVLDAGFPLHSSTIRSAAKSLESYGFIKQIALDGMGSKIHYVMADHSIPSDAK